jgi:maleate isomerase
LEEDALQQFDYEPMIQASRQLADADVDIIVWNGTSGGWLGFDVDRELCRKITEVTGIPATTSMLAQVEAFEKFNVKKIHLITPYLKPINELIKKEYAKCGVEVINDVCLNQSVNRSFSLVPQEKIQDMFAQVCTEKVDGISVVCTNFPAMWSAQAMEEKYGFTVYDTINTVVWQSMKMVSVDPDLVKGWGRLFQL